MANTRTGYNLLPKKSGHPTQRLNSNKGQQFFDSGDYNMNKAGTGTSGAKPIYLPMQQGPAAALQQKQMQAQKQQDKENVFRKPGQM